MALTKVTGQVINDTTGLVVGVTTVGGGLSATDGFFSGIVTAVGDASFSGNVSVGGTLTYEDVTNIDAVGLVTARNGIVVGSGITLSKDGDIFFTGIMTGNGSGLTGIANTSNIFADSINVGSGITLSSDGDVFAVGFTTLGSGSDGGVELFHAGTSRLSSASYGVAVNGDILFQDALTHIGDTDTKLRFPTADTISAETGGTERLRITSGGDIVTQALTETSFNNNSANTKILEITGAGADGKYATINISGNQNSTNELIGSINFINRENSNSSSGSNAASRRLAVIDVQTDTDDSNAGDDCGGYMRFVTKANGGGGAERMRISSSGYITGNGNVPCWYGKQDTHHTVTNSTWTVIKNLATDAINPTMNNGGWDESNGRFTVQEGQAGIYYCFGASGMDDIQDADVVYIGICKNGESPNAYSYSRALDQSSNLVHGGGMISRVLALDVGDYVEAKIYHNEGSTEYTEPQFSFFGGYRLVSFGNV